MMTQLVRMSHAGMLNSDVVVAFRDRWGSSGFRRASQTMSALLRSAEKAGIIKAAHSSGPVTGNTTIYWMTAEQIDELRNKACAKALRNA